MDELFSGGIFPFIMFIFIAISMVVGVAADAKKKAERQEKEKIEYAKKTERAPKQQKRATTMTPTAPQMSVMKSQFDDYDSSRKMKSRLIDNSGHTHGGADNLEKVDPITGSLGGVSTEGCAELANVRMLTTIDYDENDNEQVSFDYDALVSAIVFGSAISEPKGKF